MGDSGYERVSDGYVRDLSTNIIIKTAELRYLAWSRNNTPTERRSKSEVKKLIQELKELDNIKNQKNLTIHERLSRLEISIDLILDYIVGMDRPILSEALSKRKTGAET